MIRRFAALAAVTALAACAHGATTSTSAPPESGQIGYVRMDELIAKHPLYPQLAQYNRSIEAFDLAATAPRAIAEGPDVQAREQDLQHQLRAAADRTNALLVAKEKQYQREESSAIAAALQSAGAPGPSAGQIAGSLNATARQQAGAAAAQAQRDFAQYRQTLQRAGNAQIAAAQKTLADRAARTYRSQADALQSKEAALSLRLADEDAPQRLALRTKLSSLALDDAARTQAEQQLAALDRKEADAVAAQRNRDQQTLAALQAQLRAQVESDLRTQVDRVHQRSMTLLGQRQSALAKQLANVGAGLSAPAAGNARTAAALSPALRGRIEQLHKDYQRRFQSDAQATIAAFTKTRDDLSRRYAQLRGVDGAAQESAQAQVAALRRKRDELYSQITGQIGREVRVIAQERGISVVFTDVVAHPGGIDLTDAALKDMQSLHE